MSSWSIVILLVVATIELSRADQVSGRIFDLSSLFNLNRPNYNRPPYYGNGYNPSNYPGGSGIYPGAGYNPAYPGIGQGGAYPGVGNPGGVYPGVINPGGAYPGAYPGFGTSMLGGNGGYGGFGGNGGLPTYYGYNSNNYYGNRNLGYAYYKNTNTNGLNSADG